jgi:hypothetical protein
VWVTVEGLLELDFLRTKLTYKYLGSSTVTCLCQQLLDGTPTTVGSGSSSVTHSLEASGGSRNPTVPPFAVPSPATPVRINYKVRLIDAEGQIVVERHVPAKDLSRHPLISELHQVFGCKVVVSPEGSPNRIIETGDRVRVDTNSDSFMDKFYDEWKRRWETEYNHILQVGNATSLRLIKDWAILRMRRSAKIPANTSHNDAVTTFLRKYNTTFPRHYLESLKNSEERRFANITIHSDPKDDEEAEALWKSLRQTLTEEDRHKGTIRKLEGKNRVLWS